MFVMLPLAWWLALPGGYGAWGVLTGVAVASVLAGLGQIALLEIVSSRRARRAAVMVSA